MGSNFARQDTDISQLLLGNNYKKREQTLLLGNNILTGMMLGSVNFVVDTVTYSGTGNGTVTEYALSATGKPKVGDYILTCVEIVATDGLFNLVDPDGITIATDIVIALADTSIVVFTGGGITFKITSGATPFAAADEFTIPMAAGSGKLKQVISTSVDGSQYPKFVAIADEDATAADIVTEVLASGEINIGKMVFDGAETIETLVDGKSYYDYLKETGILALTSQTTGSYDNA